MPLYFLRLINQKTIMATCNHYQHRQLAREAAWLEIRGDYADAAPLCRSCQPLRSL